MSSNVSTAELRYRPPWARDGCLPACCATVLNLLFGANCEDARLSLCSGFAAIIGGPTFTNARVLLARLYRVDSDVVSGGLNRMLELNGWAGLIILGINPRLLYERTASSRHAVLLMSCLEQNLPPCIEGILDVEQTFSEFVSFLDPASPASLVTSRYRTKFSNLERAFDSAGREGLMVRTVRLERMTHAVGLAPSTSGRSACVDPRATNSATAPSLLPA